MTSQTMIIVIASLSFSSLWFFALLAFTDRWHSRVVEDRQMLLQRIQAPQAAADQHVIQTAQPQAPMTPRFDHDEDLHDLMIGIDPLRGAE